MPPMRAWAAAAMREGIMSFVSLQVSCGNDMRQRSVSDSVMMFSGVDRTVVMTVVHL